MRIEKASRSLKPPTWWNSLISFIPDIRLNFLNLYIKKNNRLRDIVENIPTQCPFEKGYYLVVLEKKILIYYVPALCKLNPLFNWIIDLKVEIFEQRLFDTQQKSLVLSSEDSLLFVNSLLKSEMEIDPALRTILKNTKKNYE